MLNARPIYPLALALLLFFGASTLQSTQVDDCSNIRWTKKAGSFDLQMGKCYEQQWRWKEAEQEYLQAGRVGTVDVKNEAFAGLQRIAIHHSSDVDSAESDLGKFYEDRDEWKEAEQHYTASAKDLNGERRTSVLTTAAKVHEKLWLQEGFENLYRYIGYLVSFLVVVYLGIVINRVCRIRRSIQIMPVATSTDESRQRLIFALTTAREELPSLLAPVLTNTFEDVIDAMPVVILPGIEDQLPDATEDLEIGEVKLPIGPWVKLFSRPAVRVFSSWNVGFDAGSAKARIERRRFMNGYREDTRIRTVVVPVASEIQENQITLFAYDVLVKAILLRRNVS